MHILSKDKHINCRKPQQLKVGATGLQVFIGNWKARELEIPHLLSDRVCSNVIRLRRWTSLLAALVHTSIPLPHNIQDLPLAE